MVSGESLRQVTSLANIKPQTFYVVIVSSKLARTLTQFPLPDGDKTKPFSFVTTQRKLWTESDFL